MVAKGTASSDPENVPVNESEDVLAWIPKTGDVLRGKVDYITRGGLAKRDGGFGIYPILEFEIEEGTRDEIPLAKGDLVTVHAFHSTLWSALKRLNIQPGDRVSIVYAGQKTEGGRFGKGFHLYKVRPLDPKPFDWGPEEDWAEPED